MIHSILLVGGTGMLGSEIADSLLDHADARVRLLVRANDDDRKKALVTRLLNRGAESVEGDLADPASMDRATAGIDVIVSAVQGGPDVMIDGQVALARAGRQNGVRRMFPSDFALDLFKATPGEHAMFDLKAKADTAIREVGLAQTHVLQGAFMDLFLPGNGAIDLDAGTVSFFGDGHLPIEVTSVHDTAKMVAHVALDPEAPDGKFAFAGDRISFRQAAAAIEAQTGRALRPVSLGSEADLRAAMKAADAKKKLMLAYLLYMMNGQTALSALQNDRYSGMRFESFASYVARTVPSAA